MQTFRITQAEAPTVAAMIENEWSMLLPDVARNAAWLMTMLQEVGAADLTRLIGPDLAQRSQALIAETKRLYEVAQLLDTGGAYLIPWQATPEEGGGQHVAVARGGVPASGELGAWPIYVAMGIGALITGAVVIIAKWETDVETLRVNNEQLELRIMERIQTNAEALMATDPAAATRLMEANSKALAAQNTAARNPSGWLSRAFSLLGKVAAGAAVPALMWLLGFWAFTRFGTSRREAAA